MKYLIHCGPGIGDFIIVLPMAQIIKENDPKSKITIFTRSDKERIQYLKEMLTLQTYIDEVLYYNPREPIHDIPFLLSIGINKYDYGFKSSYIDNGYISNIPYLIIKIASKKTVGITLKNKPNFHFNHEVRFNSERSVYLRGVRLVNELGYAGKGVSGQPLFSKEKIMSLLPNKYLIKSYGSIISLVVGAADAPVTADGKHGSKPAKRWPYTYWIDLAKMFIKNGYQVVLLGGEREGKELQNLNISYDINNYCGKCSITESIGLICQSILVIGSDTGLMHCAGALGVPSLTLFGCTSYKDYLFPSEKSFHLESCLDCSPCFGTDSLLYCKDYKCMKELLPITVFEYSNSIIKGMSHEC